MFNWFKRPQQPALTPEPVPPVESNPAEKLETAPPETPAGQDYLAFAKVAYQNIQRQKEESEKNEEVEEVREVEEVEGVLDSDSALVVEEAASADSELVEDLMEDLMEEVEVLEVQGVEELEVVPEISLDIVDDRTESDRTPENIGEADKLLENPVDALPEVAIEVPEINLEINLEINPEIIVVPEPTALPAWARETEEQRLARLESLVVVEAEIPEPVVAEEIAADGVVPGLDFDDNFLWSTQVLASQGRRPEDISAEEISWLKRLRQGLERTRLSLVNQLKAIVGQGPLDKDAVEAIETLLLQADVGVEATDYIITTLQAKLKEEVLPPDQAIAYLKKILRDLLDKPLQENYSPNFTPEKATLNIWMMTGVNGAGKTTTIGKLAHLAQKSGYSCLIGAADTFRAAAVEQVKIWGQRSGTEVIANPGQNTDPGSVVFDAIAAAQSRNIELLLIDTAGRLQNKKNLMDELGKIRRIVDKKAPHAKVESLLVLDATLGQNGLRQAEVFAEAAKLSGVVLTKLDGTAKGGVALAVVQQLGLPIRFIGAGEGLEDLRPFSSYEFVEALLNG